MGETGLTALDHLGLIVAGVRQGAADPAAIAAIEILGAAPQAA